MTMGILDRILDGSTEKHIMDMGKEVIDQAVAANKILAKIIEKKLLPAYLGAAIRQYEGNMHSSSISMEIILFVAGTMNIEKAVNTSVAKSDEFVLFASRTGSVNYLESRFDLHVVKKYDLCISNVDSGVAITAIKYDK